MKAVTYTVTAFFVFFAQSSRSLYDTVGSSLAVFIQVAYVK
jgi:hypothetical protein